MEKGLPLGQGVTADVFEWGKNEVVKLFKQGYPAHLAENESYVCRRVYELGLPVPCFGGTVKIGERIGLIFEMVNGSTLIGLTAANPSKLEYYAKLMSELHLEIHRHRMPEIPFWGGRMAAAIRNHPLSAPAEKAALLEELYRGADGDTLCHGDFHPYNIVVSSRGPVIIDWGNAGRGNQAADVGLTSLGLKTGPLPRYEENKAVIESFRFKFCGVYLEEYLRLSALPRNDIALWEAHLDRCIKVIQNKS